MLTLRRCIIGTLLASLPWVPVPGHAANLTAYYPMDETSGPVLNDAIGSNHCLTTNLVLGEPGVLGNACRPKREL